MDESSQASTQPSEAAQIPRKEERPMNEQEAASHSLQDLINAFFKKVEEFEAHLRASDEVFGRFDIANGAAIDHLNSTNLDVSMIDLDSITTLHDYDVLFDLENECSKRESDCLAEERIHVKMVDGILALAVEIMDNHATELGDVDSEIRDRFAGQRASFVEHRNTSLVTWNAVVRAGWQSLS